MKGLNSVNILTLPELYRFIIIPIRIIMGLWDFDKISQNLICKNKQGKIRNIWIIMRKLSLCDIN